jgi:hypothetical protein
VLGVDGTAGDNIPLSFETEHTQRGDCAGDGWHMQQTTSHWLLKQNTVSKAIVKLSQYEDICSGARQD